MNPYSFSLRHAQRYNTPAEDIMSKALEQADTLYKLIKEKRDAKS